MGVSLRGTTNGTRGIMSHFLKAMVQFYDLFVVAFTLFLCALNVCALKRPEVEVKASTAGYGHRE